MKNYEKPIVLANSELSEGVYAASGGTGCFSYEGYSGGSLSGNDGYEFNVRFKHSSEAHMEGTHTFVIYFDSTPVSATTNTNSANVQIGTSSITFAGVQKQANGGEGYDIGVKVKFAGDVAGKPTGGYGYID